MERGLTFRLGLGQLASEVHELAEAFPRPALPRTDRSDSDCFVEGESGHGALSCHELVNDCVEDFDDLLINRAVAIVVHASEQILDASVHQSQLSLETLQLRIFTACPVRLQEPLGQMPRMAANRVRVQELDATGTSATKVLPSHGLAPAW